MIQDSLSVRRLVENELQVRQSNEQAATAMKSLFSEDEPVFFYCECSNEACRERIALRVVDYQHIHRQRDNFIVLPDHEDEQVETIVMKCPTYNVVKKFDL